MFRCFVISLSLAVAACRGGDSPAPTRALGEQAQVVPYFVCRYENPFTHVEECKEYRGSAFDEGAAKKACAKPFTGVVGKLGKVACSGQGAIGTCTEGEGTAQLVVTWVYGGFRAMYAGACERFVRGKWRDGTRVAVNEPPVKLMDEARRAMASTQSVSVEPACSDEACLEKLVAARGAIWFRPLHKATQAALVLYPGAAVDPRAYAPLSQAIAAAGVAVAIVPMQGNLALTGIDRVRDLQRASPEIKRWFLAGHSMGGAMAARFVAHGEGREALAGLLLWAAYPSDDDDLSKTALPVLSVYGSQDGRTTLAKIEASRKLLPSTTHYQPIEGGNHAQFGWYGLQDGDLVAYIDRAQQQDMIVAASLQFIYGAGAIAAADQRFALAAERDRTLCREAQVTLPNLVALAATRVTSQEVLDPKAFSVAKARVGSAEPARVIAIQRTVRRGQSDKLDAPAVLAREVWCKLKNQGVLATALALDAAGPEGTCRGLNQATLEWTRKQLTATELASVGAQPPMFEALPDRSFATGPEWLVDGGVELNAALPPKLGLSVRSASLTVASDAQVDEAFRGVHYCKLLASEEALLRWLTLAARL